MSPSHATRMTLRQAKGRPALRTTYSIIDPRTLVGSYLQRTHREPDPLYTLRVKRLNSRYPVWPPLNRLDSHAQAEAAWIARQRSYCAARAEAYSPVCLP